MTPEEFTARYMPQFSEQQKAAVRETEGPVLLLAVPGSGKTTVLVTRLGYMALCRGIDPAHILAVTYTVAATQEMRARFAARRLRCRKTPASLPRWSGASIRR